MMMMMLMGMKNRGKYRSAPSLSVADSTGTTRQDGITVSISTLNVRLGSCVLSPCPRPNDDGWVPRFINYRRLYTSIVLLVYELLSLRPSSKFETNTLSAICNLTPCPRLLFYRGYFREASYIAAHRREDRI